MKQTTTSRHRKWLVITMIFLAVSLAVTTPALANTSPITYDANGNRISGFGYYYEYNNFNQLSRVRQNNATGTIIEEYEYDHEGNRVLKSEPPKNQSTYYFGSDFVTVVNDSGTFDTVYIYDEKDLVARKELWSNRTFFYHPDHLGSTSLITNETGQVVEETTYEPFGKVYAGGSDRFLYTGKELDRGTGLEYYGARYYDPSNVSQFVQPDPFIGDLYDPQQLNRYAYVRENPYKYTDPTGHFLWFVEALIIGWGVLSTLDAGQKFVEDPNLETGTNLAIEVTPIDELKDVGKGADATIHWLDDAAKGAGKTADEAADVGKGVKNFRSFTEGNFRENLETRIGRPLTDMEQAHHTLPQNKEFAKKFEDTGINIHDPKFGVPLDKTYHGHISYDYNEDWKKFFAEHFQPTQDEILEKGRELADKYGYKVDY